MLTSLLARLCNDLQVLVPNHFIVPKARRVLCDTIRCNALLEVTMVTRKVITKMPFLILMTSFRRLHLLKMNSLRQARLLTPLPLSDPRIHLLPVIFRRLLECEGSCLPLLPHLGISRLR